MDVLRLLRSVFTQHDTAPWFVNHHCSGRRPQGSKARLSVINSEIDPIRAARRISKSQRERSHTTPPLSPLHRKRHSACTVLLKPKLPSLVVIIPHNRCATPDTTTCLWLSYQMEIIAFASIHSAVSHYIYNVLHICHASCLPRCI